MQIHCFFCFDEMEIIQKRNWRIQVITPDLLSYIEKTFRFPIKEKEKSHKKLLSVCQKCLEPWGTIVAKWKLIEEAKQDIFELRRELAYQVHESVLNSQVLQIDKNDGSQDYYRGQIFLRWFKELTEEYSSSDCSDKKDNYSEAVSDVQLRTTKEEFSSHSHRSESLSPKFPKASRVVTYSNRKRVAQPANCPKSPKPQLPPASKRKTNSDDEKTSSKQSKEGVQRKLNLDASDKSNTTLQIVSSTASDAKNSKNSPTKSDGISLTMNNLKTATAQRKRILVPASQFKSGKLDLSALKLFANGAPGVQTYRIIGNRVESVNDQISENTSQQPLKKIKIVKSVENGSTSDASNEPKLIAKVVETPPDLPKLEPAIPRVNKVNHSRALTVSGGKQHVLLDSNSRSSSPTKPNLTPYADETSTSPDNQANGSKRMSTPGNDSSISLDGGDSPGSIARMRRKVKKFDSSSWASGSEMDKLIDEFEKKDRKIVKSAAFAHFLPSSAHGNVSPNGYDALVAHSEANEHDLDYVGSEDEDSPPILEDNSESYELQIDEVE